MHLQQSADAAFIPRYWGPRLMRLPFLLAALSLSHAVGWTTALPDEGQHQREKKNDGNPTHTHLSRNWAQRQSPSLLPATLMLLIMLR